MNLIPTRFRKPRTITDAGKAALRRLERPEKVEAIRVRLKNNPSILISILALIISLIGLFK